MSFDEGRLKELQDALRVKVADNQAIADSFRVEDGITQIDTERKAAFDRNMADIREIKSLIQGLEGLKEVQDWSAEPTRDSIATKAAAGQGLYVPGSSLGAAFLASDEFKALKGGRMGANMPSPFEVKAADIAGLRFKDVYSALPDGTPGSFGTIQRDDMVTMPQRRRRVRDLFPVRTTTAAVIEYFRQTGYVSGVPTGNNAATVAERDEGDYAAKPQSTLSFRGEQSPVRTIAHWESAHRNTLADEPQLRAIIDNELLYGLRLAEDDQILNGDGSGENLLGVLETDDIQSYSWSSGAVTPVPDNKCDAIRRAATLAFLANYEPTGVVVHPNDWEDMELTKNEQGSYLLAVSMNTGADQRIWRIPVIDTPAIDEGTALVGAFGTGAQLYDREQATIRISEQHADFFIRNAIVILAEERLALAVKRPESFVKVTFDGAPD
jgi:HK97 family phage major capsid protein